MPAVAEMAAAYPEAPAGRLNGWQAEAQTARCSGGSMEPEAMKYPWYALQVRPRYECAVALVLENKGYEAYLPARTRRRRWSDRVVELREPVFPGYLFCRLDVTARLLPLYTTPGFRRILGVGRWPCAVPEQEIEGIRRIVESGMEAETVPMPKAGERVRLETGPLAGLEGTLVRVQKRHTFVVSVALLQRAVSVEVPQSCVRRIGMQERGTEGEALPAAARIA
jgi:transcription antitermination factor NusG